MIIVSIVALILLVLYLYLVVLLLAGRLKKLDSQLNTVSPFGYRLMKANDAAHARLILNVPRLP